MHFSGLIDVHDCVQACNIIVQRDICDRYWSISVFVNFCLL